MPQSLVQIYLHIVFSTLHRAPLLKSRELRFQTHSYLAGICRKKECPTLRVGGVEDHVHLLCRMSRKMEVANLIRDLKRDSTRWIKRSNPNLRRFHWQRGYGAFSVSPSHVEALKRYIADQEKHHQTESFEEEFRRLCAKYGVEIDERYGWD